MEFKINIAKKHLYYLVGLLVFVFITAIAIAQTSAPNPGHAAGEIGEGTIANTLTVSGEKVGIGTINPATKLNVVGDVQINANGKLYFPRGADQSQTAYIYNSVTGDSGSNLQIVGDGSSLGVITLQPGTSGSVIVTQGNVGIGTISPGQKLHVSGGRLQLDNNLGVLQFFNAAGNDQALQLYVDTNNLARIQNNFGAIVLQQGGGNVGIGLSPGNGKLDVAGIIDVANLDGDFFRTYGATDTNKRWALANSAAGLFQIIQRGDSWVDQGTRLTIDRGGKVGIGTTSPRGKLQIGNLHDTFGVPTYPGDFILDGSPSGSNAVGGIEFRTSVSAAGAGWKITAAGTYQDSKLFFANRAGSTTWDTEVLTLTNTGKVGIGTSSPEMTLDVNGGIRAHAVLETKVDSAPTDQKIWQLNTQTSGFYIGTWNDARNAEQLAYQIRRSGYAVTSHNWLINNQQKMVLDENGDVIINSLAGSGNAYACVSANGRLYRSATACS